MTEPQKDNDTQLPAPLPTPEPSAPTWLIGRRYLIILAIIVIFFLVLFLSPGKKPVTQVTPAHELAAPEVKEKPGQLPGVITEPTPAPEVEPEAATPEPALPPPLPLPEEKPRPVPEVRKPVETPAPVPAPALAPTPAEKQPAAHARPEAALRVAEKPVRGEAFTRALIKIIDDQVNRRWLGWRPNSIILGYMGLTDNVNNLQLGVLEVARRTTVVLNENMTRFATTEAYNPHINEAMNFLMVSPDKYWFPSASGKYKEAVADFYRYIDDLKNNRSRFYGRVDNLIALMVHFKDILGSCFHNLLKDTEANGKPVSWTTADDYFYFSQGVAIGMYQVLEGVLEDFSAELHKKNSHKLLEDAIHALHTASELNPWFITDAAKDGILANHRANISTYIGEAEHLISTLQTVLATN